jgi:protocatechuate 3,4-dioxygenase, beta subunit
MSAFTGKTVLGIVSAIVLSTLCAVAADKPSMPAQLGDRCVPTPSQTEGPYYPPKAQMDAQQDADSDLTQIKGDTGKPAGQVLYVTGRLRDSQCRPIEGASVEIWQASENGRYRHPRDKDNAQPLDPHFQYWGKSITDKDGRYQFKTIKPGAYSIGAGRIRPSHIHFKVTHPNFPDFVTQLYFTGDSYQDKDGILNSIPPAQRNQVIVGMEAPARENEQDAKTARFDLTLP